MLNFSELTLPQKKLIKSMRQGCVLKYIKSQKGYFMTDGKFTWSVRIDTAYSLWKRHFIIQCHDDEKEIIYYANVEITYGKYLDEHNNLVGC